MLQKIVSSLSLFAIPALLLLIPAIGIIRRVKVYEVFVEGAKEGFQTAVRIIPFLVAMLVAIGIFRSSGTMELLTTLISPITSLLGIPPQLVPMGVMRSLSGGGAEGMMVELFSTYGADSFIGRAASVTMGSTETTMYVVAVYYGAIGIKKTRHTIPVGLTVDAISFFTAVLITNILFSL